MEQQDPYTKSIPAYQLQAKLHYCLFDIKIDSKIPFVRLPIKPICVMNMEVRS
jgi:hypothetical protein